MGVRGWVLLAVVASSFVPGVAAFAYCGKDVSCRPGSGPKTSCPGSRARLHFQFNEIQENVGTPCNDEEFSTVIVPSPTPVATGGIFDGGFSFSGGQRILVGGNNLDASTASSTDRVGVSFWIYPHSPISDGTIVYKGETSGLNCSGGTAPCRNYEVRLRSNGTFSLFYQRADANKTIVECSTSVFAAPIAVQDRWQHVTLGINRPGQTMGTCGANQDCFTYRINGQEFRTATSNCTGSGGGAAASKGMVAVAGPLVVGGGDGATGIPNLNAILDELQVHVGNPSGEPEASTIGMGGVMILQVLFDVPNRYDRVLLYRSYALPSGLVSFPSGQAFLRDSQVADDAVESGYNPPATISLAPGGLAEITLCASGCGTDEGSSGSSCQRIFTNGMGAANLGACAVEAEPCPGNDCGCETDARDLDASDSIVVYHGGVPKAGVAWGAARPPPGDANFTGALRQFGGWPTAGSDLLGWSEVALTTTGSTMGFKLAKLGSDGNTIDGYVAITSTSQATICESTSTTGATGRLSRFSATSGGRGARLEWETIDELDARSFRVYRSLGGDFHLLTEVAAHGGPGGAEYSHTDRVDDGVREAWYGLEMIDAQGSIMDAHTPVHVRLAGAGPGCGCSISTRGQLPGAFLGLLVLLVVMSRRKVRDID